MRFIALLIIIAVSFLDTARAEDKYLLVGGGPVPKDYHVSMERNIIWLQDLISRWSFSSGEIWYGLGNDGDPDVLFTDPEDPSVSHWEPLARVFGETLNNRLRLRRNWVEANSGPYSYSNVSDALARKVGALDKHDSLFFVYSGHGSGSSEGLFEMNGLRLLDDVRYTAKSLAEVLENATEGSHVRFVLPQCFSGGFLRSVFRTPDRPSLSSLMPAHCGFTSIPEEHIAEGCTVGVNSIDYRDYSTYFFAALAGQSRTGETLPINPDFDGNGQVSLLEAHFFAFSEAQSTDIPSSTSEYILRLSQPWYSRWLPRFRKSSDNPYTKLAKRLATRIGVDHETSRHLMNTSRLLIDEIKQIEETIKQLENDELPLRESLNSRLNAVSSVKYKPLSQTVTTTPSPQALKAIDWVRAQSDYPRLVEMQDKIESLKIEHLEMRRQLAQFEKIFRANQLANSLDRLRHSTKHDDVAAFDSLHACESWSPKIRQDKAAAKNGEASQ